MKKLSKKLIRDTWRKFNKCYLYVKAKEKSASNTANDELFMKCIFFLEYTFGILNCLKESDSKVITAEYIDHTGRDDTYTRSAWYAKLRRANIAFFKYFDKRVLVNA